MKTAIITAIICLSTVFSSWGWTKQQKDIKGSGYILTEQRATSPFESIEVSRAIKVFLSQGEKLEITVEADDNLLPYIKTEIKEQTLKIYLPDDTNITTHSDMNVFVTVPKITKLEVSTAAKIEGTNPWKMDNLSLDVTTAGSVKLELTAGEIEAEASTAARIELKGTATKLEADVTTAANLKARELKVKIAKIDASTAGNVEIDVTEQLRYDVNTGAKLIYKGDAHTTGSESITGGKVVKEK